MRRMLLTMMAMVGVSAFSFGQAAQTAVQGAQTAQAAAQPTHAAQAETQTLQALLSEVRALRQDLRASLNRAQNVQILLARLQIQEGVTTRAMDRLNDARQKMLDTQFHQKELGLEQKQIEESLPAPDPQQQSDLLDKLNHVKSDLEVTGRMAQQQQTAETQVEQQTRAEEDKLNALEAQLDDLIGSMGDSNSKPESNRQ
jgi:hypothetical protein